MTLTNAITLVLARTGLATSNTTYVNRARDYMSAVGKSIVAEMGGKWWFLFKTTTFSTTKTITVSGITGTIASGDTITDDGGSGATATVDSAYDATNYPTAVLVNAQSGTFTAAGGLTFSGGATATFSSIAVTQTYALASDVLVPHAFYDTTNDRRIIATDLDRIEAADPDRDYETDGRVWAIDSVDAITGYQLVRLFPYHDTPGDTIRYRYRAFVPDWTSGDDSTDMARWFPQILQPALWHGAAALYLLEKGDTEAAGAEQALSNNAVEMAKETNRTIYGNRQWRRSNVPDVSGTFNYVPADGSLS